MAQRGRTEASSRPPGPDRAPAAALDKTARAAVIGASFGFFVDMFDVYLPVIALTPAMGYFVPESLSADSKAILNSLIFVATLLGRPVGSFIFGRLADRIGRRRTTVIAVAGCAGCTGLIAVLPGYARVGLVGVGLLVALRLADGIFLGGEYAGATPLAMEAVPTGRRGWYGGLVGMGFPLSYCAIALVTFLTLRLARPGSPDSAYSVWGWRIPFLVGVLLGMAFLVYYARSVRESRVWSSAPKSASPVRDVVFGGSRRQFLQVFVLMSGIWFASNLATGLLPSALQNQGHVSASQVTAALVIVQAVHAALFPYLGALSERIGRRAFLAWCGVGIAVPCAAVFATIAEGWWSGFAWVVLLTLVIRLAGASAFAVMPSYLCERFPASVRGSGFAIGYSTPLVLTSFYAYYQDWLAAVMPRSWTASALLVLGGALVLAGALLGPETRDVEFAASPPNESITTSANE